MAVTVRYEWIYLGKGGYAENVIKRVLGAARTDVLTTTPTAPIEIPDGHVDGDLYLRACADEATCVVQWGANVAVTLSNSLALYPGIPEVVAVDSDWQVQFRKET